MMAVRSRGTLISFVSVCRSTARSQSGWNAGENRLMRKTVISPDIINPRSHSQQKWLDLEEIATVEVTSEDPNFPIESALAAREGPGWRAAEPGKQIIRILLDIRDHCVGLDLSFRSPKLSEPRNSRCDGLKQVGHSEKSFVSNGTSVRKAQPARSKIIRSSWRKSRPWSWLSSPTLRQTPHSQLWPRGA